MLLPSTINQLRQDSHRLPLRSQSTLTVSGDEEGDVGGGGGDPRRGGGRGPHRRHESWAAGAASSGRDELPRGLSYASGASAGLDSAAASSSQHRRSRTMSGEVKFAEDFMGNNLGGGIGRRAEPVSSAAPRNPSPHHHHRRQHRRSRSARERGGETAPLLATTRRSLREDSPPKDGNGGTAPKSILRTSSRENLGGSSGNGGGPPPGTLQSILRSKMGGRGHARTGSAPDANLVPFLQSIGSVQKPSSFSKGGGRGVPPSSSSSSRHQHRRAKSAQMLPLPQTKEDEVHHHGSSEPYIAPSAASVWEATEALHYKPIRSSGIGSSSSRSTPKKKPIGGRGSISEQHRRTRSAGSPTSLLLEAYRQESLGYGAIQASQGSPAGSRSPSPMGRRGPLGSGSMTRVVSSEEFGSSRGRTRPEYRRSKTSDGLPPVSPRVPAPRKRLDSSDRSPAPGFGRPAGTTRQRLDSDGSASSAVKFAFHDSQEQQAVDEEAAASPPHPLLSPNGGGLVEPPSSSFVFDNTAQVARDVNRPRQHRRMTSNSSGMSLASAATAGTDMSVTSHKSDLAKSSLFRGVTDAGHVEQHLPMDNVRLVIDDTLEPGVVYKFREPDEENMFQEYHIVTDDPDEYLLDADDLHLACGCGCDHCRMCAQKKQRLLPEVRYVIAIDDTLNQRVLSEISASTVLPCGLYYCMRDEHAGRPSAWIAGVIVAAVMGTMMVFTVLWGGT